MSYGESEIAMSAKMEELLSALGKQMGDRMPKGYGFAVLVFRFDGRGLFYVSSADRRGVIKAMREFIQKYGEQ